MIDPEVLLEEIESLGKSEIKVDSNSLSVSDKVHIIMPYHKAIDLAKEAAKGKEKIGTTGRGIGPCYEDKVARTGIRSVDLTDPEVLEEKIRYMQQTDMAVYLGCSQANPGRLVHSFEHVANQLAQCVVELDDGRVVDTIIHGIAQPLQALGPAVAAAILGLVACVIVAVILMVALKTIPHQAEEKLACEIRDLANTELNRDIDEVKAEISQITDDVRSIRTGIMAVPTAAVNTLFPALRLLIKAVKK